MKKENIRNLVYSNYNSSPKNLIDRLDEKKTQLGFLYPDKCYELIHNEREINPRLKYSRSNIFYKVKW